MPRPETLQDVLALVRRSRLVDDRRLDGFLALLASAGFADAAPDGVLALMVERGLLTAFQAAELLAGRWRGFWLGSYRVLDRLGAGGMGQVFLAEHTLLARRAAVKVLSGALQADPTARRRVVLEARAAAAIDHPNVVHVYDVEADHDPPFLVMEYVDGVSLQAAVVRHGAFAAGEAAAVGVQAAAGLAEVARVGLTHRDIKPANLLVDRRGVLKVLDLGIARFQDAGASHAADGLKVILGTVDYLAPEQAVDSSGVDARADLYALGGTLYYLLAGHPPYPDGDPLQKIARKQTCDPAPLAGLRPDVPAGLAAAVHRLLARDPAARFPTAAAAAAALRPWADVPSHFPDRLFRPRAAAPDDPGAATDPGRDRDPTPLPVTRRIVRGQTVRAAVTPAGPPSSVLAEPAPEPDSDAGGPPTTPMGPARTSPRLPGIETALAVAAPTGQVRAVGPAVPAAVAEARRLHRRVAWSAGVGVGAVVALATAGYWWANAPPAGPPPRGVSSPRTP